MSTSTKNKVGGNDVTTIADEELKRLKILLEEEVFQVPKQVEKVHSLPTNCGFTGILKVEIRSGGVQKYSENGILFLLQFVAEKTWNLKRYNVDEAMIENIEEETTIVVGHEWKMNLYVLEMNMREDWNMNYGVLMQE